MITFGDRSVAGARFASRDRCRVRVEVAIRAGAEPLKQNHGLGLGLVLGKPWRQNRAYCLSVCGKDHCNAVSHSLEQGQSLG